MGVVDHGSKSAKVLLGKAVVEFDGAADVGAFFGVGAGKEAALEPGKDEIAELAVGEGEVTGAEQELVGDAGVGDKAVVGADADGEAMVDHELDGVVFQRLELGEGLQVARWADLDGDALVGDVFAELGDVAGFVLDGFELDGGFGEEEGAVADAVGVAFGDGLEDGFGAIGLASVHGFAQEVAVGALERGLVVDGGIAGLFAGKIEPDDGQALIAKLDGFLHEGKGRAGVGIAQCGGAAAVEQSFVVG